MNLMLEPAVHSPERRLAEHLIDLGLQIRRRASTGTLSAEARQAVVGRLGGDTIFGLDRDVEALMVETIERWPGALLPVGLFAEGLEPAPLIIGQSGGEPVRYWLIIDPIDGTRGLMYDKRSAVFLAAAAPGTTPSPRLSDAVVSVGVELPTAKQGLADIFSWVRGEGVQAWRQDLRTLERSPLHPAPSSAVSIDQGFGSVAAYFPAGKARAAKLAEAIARRSGPDKDGAQVFDDQFMSSGGQMMELLMGHDRFVVDLRPIFAPAGQCAHPYDLALRPLAAACGVILTGPDGQTLDAPFDLTSAVAWCGYANPSIRALVEPAVMVAAAKGA